MFDLCCTVRHCGRPLSKRDRGLFCEANHHFDQAKEGYWSLLQPQDRKSAKPGDCDEAVLARHRWIALGHMEGMINRLQTWTSSGQVMQNQETVQSHTTRTLDLGCGEGSFGKALFAEQANHYCGIDLSKRAIRLAARSWRSATWVIANADRKLPVSSQSVDCVISLFGRRPVDEIARVLRPGGICVVTVPGEADLIELREKVQASGDRRSRVEAIVNEMENGGLRLRDHAIWTHRVHLERDAIRDALTMTYRAVRKSQQAKLESIESMKVTLAADLMLFAT